MHSRAYLLKWSERVYQSCSFGVSGLSSTLDDATHYTIKASFAPTLESGAHSPLLRVRRFVATTNRRYRACPNRSRLEARRRFLGHLMIGEDYELSILAPHWAWEAGAAVFELWDGERSLTYWVRKIPTPRQTATLLTEHGGRPRKSEANPASSIPSAAKEADPTNAASRTRAPESYTRMVHAGLRAGWSSGCRKSLGYVSMSRRRLYERSDTPASHNAHLLRTLCGYGTSGSKPWQRNSSPIGGREEAQGPYNFE